MQSEWTHADRMAIMVQIRNVPDGLHRRLKARAATAGMSLSEYLLGELRRVAETPSRDELLERLNTRAPVELPESPADAVRAERDAR
jgi:plasmid stability protein